MIVSESYELYERLLRCKLLENSPEFWWPNYGSFEVIIGAILTQNSQWKRVEISLDNLRNNDLLSLENILTCKDELLIECIRPSGMFQNKSKYIKGLSQAISDDFGDFENFTCHVDREWLLKQKGIGKETADSILCYACKRCVMVVDTYTYRLLMALGYEFSEYDDLQSWFDVSDEVMAARFHGMIVEYVKGHL
ncbi:MAG: 3-methyladenine DNA glycosylase [Campylobacterota bacterium]|nr:3-methyladenine DNA glycosylase [Campylobacterota bacterium]